MGRSRDNAVKYYSWFVNVISKSDRDLFFSQYGARFGDEKVLNCRESLKVSIEAWRMGKREHDQASDKKCNVGQPFKHKIQT